MIKVLTLIAVAAMAFGGASLLHTFTSRGATSTTHTTTVKTLTDTVVVNTNTIKNNKATTTTKRIKILQLNSDRTVYVVGEVGSNSTFIAQRITELSSESTEPIYLVIDSPGGSVFRGALVLAAMEASKAPIYTVCYNICASMAAIIHQYGDKRYSLDRSVLMFHPAAGGYDGDMDRIASFSTFAKLYVDKMDLRVASQAKMSLEEYKEIASRELWIDAEDALARHFTDELVFVNLDSKSFDSEVKEKSDQHKFYHDILYRIK